MRIGAVTGEGTVDDGGGAIIHESPARFVISTAEATHENIDCIHRDYHDRFLLTSRALDPR
jgi:hypothetical protein